MADFWTGEDADFLFVSETQQSDKDCYIVVQCISSVSKNVKFPTLKYSTDGLTWYDCTDLYPGEGEDIATSVTASPAGINHTFAWNSDAASPGGVGSTWDGMIKLKFGVKNADDSGSETTRESDWFRLDFAAPICSVGWPHSKSISDTTPVLERNASDNSGPIETDWVIDDDPTFANGNGRQQTKAWSADSTFQVTKIRCRDSSPSVNTSAWDEDGEFELTLPIKPHHVTDGVDSIGFIVDETAISLENRLREYESDSDHNAGGANIVEWVARKPLRISLKLIDGPVSDVFEQFEQAMTWFRGRTLVDIEDEGDSPIAIGGLNISYVPSDWVIVSVRVINRPMRENLLYYEIVLQEV
jgi:hypothetical protein